MLHAARSARRQVFVPEGDADELRSSELSESRPDVARAQAMQRLGADDLQDGPAAFVQGVCAGFPKPCAGQDEPPPADSGDFGGTRGSPRTRMVRPWRVADLPPDAKPGR